MQRMTINWKGDWTDVEIDLTRELYNRGISYRSIGGRIGKGEEEIAVMIWKMKMLNKLRAKSVVD